MPIFVKIDQRGLAWRGVEFWPFPLTCVVAFTTLSHDLASVLLFFFALGTIDPVD